jgi:Protein of unknown function (DUF3106)
MPPRQLAAGVCGTQVTQELAPPLTTACTEPQSVATASEPPLVSGVGSPQRRRTTAARRTLLAAAIVLPGLMLGTRALAQPASPAGPAWNQLSPQQREALAPLAGQWASIPADSKRKWLEIADKYPQLAPDGKARMQARMAEFAKLTPEQRRTARENFQRAYELPLESRESAVQQYQLLPDDKKKELSERSQQRKAATKAPEQKK